MQGTEMSDFSNSPTDEEEERKQSNGFAVLGLCRVAGVGLGLMCVLQAILNISLRLHTSEPCDDITTPTEAEVERDQLQSRIYEMEAELERDQLQSIIYEMEKSYHGCPPHWVRREDSCYLFSTQKNTWLHAMLNCRARGADLFIVSRPQQQEMLYAHGADTVWIGHSSESLVANGSIHLGSGQCVSFVRFTDQLLSLNASCDVSNYWLCEKIYPRGLNLPPWFA